MALKRGFFLASTQQGFVFKPNTLDSFVLLSLANGMKTK